MTMTNKTNKLAIKILACGAKNSTIARALMNNGFIIPTFGWDFVDDNGNYMCYDNKTNKWYMDNSLLGILHNSDKFANDPFIYHDTITPKVVSILKRYGNDIFSRVVSGY